MKLILHIIAILAIGGACYFSVDLGNRLKKQQDLRIQANESNAKVSKTANTTEEERDKTKKDLAATKTQLNEVNASIESRSADLVARKKQLSGIEGDLEELNKKMQLCNESVERIKEVLKAAGLPADTTLENLDQRVKELETTKKRLENELEEKEALVATAEKKLSSNKVEIARLADLQAKRNARMANNSIESAITRVDQDWGFVVIGAGSRSGFTPQSNLLVVRDGRVIAKVRPTSIEERQTIADIIPATVANGVRLGPGDRVILEKTETR